jgi:hypothetical protein
MTLSIMTHSITILSLMKLSITIKNVRLSITALDTVMLSVANKSPNMLSVVMLSVVALFNQMVFSEQFKIREQKEVILAKCLSPKCHGTRTFPHSGAHDRVGCHLTHNYKVRHKIFFG